MINSIEVTNALIAILVGSVIAVLLFIPTAAWKYRRDGRFTLGEILTLLAAAVYAVALGTYTLLPLPDPGTFQCQPVQFEPFLTLRDVDLTLGRNLVRDPAFLQVALNVALFLPFGWFVRRILGRGIIVATVLGFGASLLIESTQGSGLWGIYDCAYRLFDVDDLILNTTGALIGSIIAWVLLPSRDRHQPSMRAVPGSVTLGRRLMAVACDGLFIVLLGGFASTAWRAKRAVVDGLAGPALASDYEWVLLWLLPAAIEALIVLIAGRTVGEWVVSTRTSPSGLTGVVLLRRMVKFAAGVGAWIWLLADDASWTGVALVVFVLVTVGSSLFTRDHRGVANWLAGLELQVAHRDQSMTGEAATHTRR